MADTIDIYINADGSIQHVYNDAIADLFGDDAQVRTRRASHVEPHPNGGWYADMAPVGGPVLMDESTRTPQGVLAFRTRAEALFAEVAWLDTHLQEGALPDAGRES
jgi:hypothetical protein